jgi:hypothetical protein
VIGDVSALDSDAVSLREALLRNAQLKPDELAVGSYGLPDEPL